MNALQSVALGEANADLVVAGGRVLLPESGEFRARDVAVVGNRIAALPEDASDVVGEDTRIVDATDRAVLPGFVDAHTHVDIIQTFENAYHYALEGGTTTVVTEASGIGGAFGPDGVEELLAATAYLPITVRVSVPPQWLVDTFEPARASDEAADRLAGLLADDRVVGVGEIDWIHVVGRTSPVERLLDRAVREGKRVTGHGAGCRNEKLAAYASVVDNDHEAITAEEFVARVENGIHAVGRYGAIRDDVDAFAEAYDRLGPAELSLSTDGMWPRELTTQGYMDAVVRRTIEAGVDPADAIRMATLNPARHFGLDDRGSLAPGNVADVVVVDDLETVNVTTVLSGGEVVVHNSEATVGPRSHEYPDRFYDSVDVTTNASAFRVPAEAARDGRVRAIEYETGLLSSPTTVEPAERDGELHADPDADLAKVTLLDRHPDGESTGFTGFIAGLGVDSGAVATSLTWETVGVLVVGVDDDAMRRAVARLDDLGGGWAVVDGDRVVVEFPMRVGGVAADLDAEETAKHWETTKGGLRTLGIDVERPMLCLQTLTFPGVPKRKLTFSGYAEVLDRAVVGLTP